MIVEELVALIGAKVEHGEFADVFQLLDHVAEAFEKVFEAAKEAVEAGFENVAKVAEHGAEIAKTAQQYGLAADALQELGYAANLSEVSTESFTNGLKFLARTASEAATNGGEAAAAFKGVSLRGSDGKMRASEEILADMAEKFKDMPNGVEKTALALKVFGRAGTEMIPMLNKGKEGLAELREEARATGAMLTEEAIESSEAWHEAHKRLGFALEGLRVAFAVPVMGHVTELFGKLQKILQSPGMKRAVLVLSQAFGVLVSALMTIADAFLWLVENEDRVEAVFVTLRAALLGATAIAAAFGATMIASAVASAAAWLAAAAPILALGAVIALIADDLYVFSVGGDSALGRVIKWFNSVDPTDSPLIKAFKEIGAWITDLGDPAKWERVKDQIRSLGKVLKESLGMPDWLGFLLSDQAKVSGPVKAEPSRGGFLDYLGDVTGIRPVAPVDKSYMTSTPAPVTINVTPPAGGSPSDYGWAVAEAWKSQISQARAAQGGN